MEIPQHTNIEGPSSLSDALNFKVLREIGLETIIQTGSEQWTDYNEHDPGITILEILTLAVTDISYRSNFRIEDILTTKTQVATPSGYFPDQFYTASEILTSSPVTLDDLRKKITDIPSVANAWVYPLTKEQTPHTGLFDVVIAPSESLQKLTAPYHSLVTRLSASQHSTLTLNLDKFRQVKIGQTVPILSLIHI